jgi:putative peptidoglycan lipid II flippase
MTKRLSRTAGLIGLATMSSRVLGLIRDSAQAWYFGTTHQADAFVVATRLPSALRDLFAEGAMSAAFVPTMSRTLARDGKEAAWRLGSQVVNGLFLVTSLIVVITIIFAEPLTRAFAGPYENVREFPGKLDLTILLARINMPFLSLIAVAAAFMGMLNALRQFTAPAMAPALYNVVFIGCIMIFVPVCAHLGVQPVMALSVGMLLGGVAQAAAQWPALRREGYHHRWILDPRDPGLREVLMLMVPGTLGAAAAQINQLVNTSLATGTSGAATALGFAFRLMYLPVGIIGVSAATAATPELARHAAAGEHDAMRKTLSWGLRLILILCVPAAIGLMVLDATIVEVIFERGAFDQQSTQLVATALFFYAPGIIGYSIVKVAAPGFYSLQDTRTPVIVSIVTIVTNLGLTVWLNGWIGFKGVALGTTIAANVNAGLLLYLLSRRLGGLDGSQIWRTLGKILVASLAMAVAVYFVEAWLHELLPARTWPPGMVRILGSIAAGMLVLAGAAHLLRIEEFGQAMERVLSRVRGATGARS